MEFESGFRFDLDQDSFGLCSQAMSTQSSASFSSTSSAYDPFTPSSRRSASHDLGLEFDSSYGSFSSAHPADLTPPSTSSMSKYVFGPIKPEQDPMAFHDTLPTTPMKKMEGSLEYENMMEMNLASQHSMGSITPSNPFGMYTTTPETAVGPAFMMTPTQSLPGSDATNMSSWACNTDSPITFFPQRSMQPVHDLEALDLDRHTAQSPLGGRYPMHLPPSPNDLRMPRRSMVEEIQRRSTDLQRAQVRGSRKRTIKTDPTVDVVRRAMCKCDYPGCHKAFRRNEHLKRHKQTFHGEGPNRFSCEFCGKDQFNRQDNLNNHRKLHARPNSRNRGVEFIPAAVAVIEQEERSRKRRAPPKSKMAAEKRGDEF